MKPPPFDYVAPETVDAALAVLADDRDTRVLAGGQSLVPILNLRLGAPEVLVDIGRLDELNRVDLSAGRLVVGANVTQQALLDNPDVAAAWPLLTAALRHIGHTQIRNRGTVCGSLAHNDPQAELPAVALALGAEMVTQSARGGRRIAADEFFTGPFTTALADDELLCAVEFPAQPPRWAFEEFSARPGDFALAGVIALSGADAEARIVVFGIGSGPMRLPALEEVLGTGDFETGDFETVASQAITGLSITDDVHASAATRRTLLTKLVIDATTGLRPESGDPR